MASLIYLDRIKKNFRDIALTKNVGAPFSDPGETRLWFVLKNFKSTCRLNESLNMAKIWYTHSMGANYKVPKKINLEYYFSTFWGIPKTQNGPKTTVSSRASYNYQIDLKFCILILQISILIDFFQFISNKFVLTANRILIMSKLESY